MHCSLPAIIIIYCFFHTYLCICPYTKNGKHMRYVDVGLKKKLIWYFFYAAGRPGWKEEKYVYFFGREEDACMVDCREQNTRWDVESAMLLMITMRGWDMGMGCKVNVVRRWWWWLVMMVWYYTRRWLFFFLLLLLSFRSWAGIKKKQKDIVDFFLHYYWHD